MKQALFLHPFRLVAKTLLLTLAIASCTKEKSGDMDLTLQVESAKAPGGSKPGTIVEVPLKLTISNDGNKITSDDGGDYVNGSQNVRVVFDIYGNLIFNNAARNGKPVVRYYRTKLDTNLEEFIDPGFIDGTGNYMATVKSSLSPFTPIQNMAEGSTQCITFHGGAGNGYVFSFHGGVEDVNSSPTALAIITRDSDTQWTITNGNCTISANTDVASIRKSGTLYGYYHMPFSFTLTKL